MRAMESKQNRMPLIDALKAIASQIIVLHHLMLYGPLAAGAALVFPDFAALLVDYGRMAVQVFLVIGGFLAARGLSPQGESLRTNPLPLIARRYLRLAIPFVIAISIAVVASALADQWMDDDAIPARATVSQWLAHAGLLHGVLGAESLSAGVWYVAIDFQLYALMALLLWIGRRRLVAPLLVCAVALSALFWFNRLPEWSNWALYFFGSYGLGAAVWWTSEKRQLRLWTGLITTVTIAALVVDFRLRIGLALAIALLLGFSRRSALLYRWPQSALLDYLGRISYGVFLIHFPVLLLVNAAFVQTGSDSTLVAVFGVLIAWTASVVAGTAFHRWVEGPQASRQINHALLWLGSQVLLTTFAGGRAVRRALRRLIVGRV